MLAEYEMPMGSSRREPSGRMPVVILQAFGAHHVVVLGKVGTAPERRPVIVILAAPARRANPADCR